MRTALLCISAEPGRDGVGDYVRQLARALTVHGHACQIIALADGFVEHASTELDPHDGIEIVRIPLSQWHRADLGLAVDRLARFKPDWVSLQLVCYGFEKGGLLWHSPARFALLRAAPRRHLMFHEVWIGAARHSSIKERSVGWLQRRLLQRTTRIWSPRVIHTSNAVYREMLRGAQIDAAELPVPSSIPFREIDPQDARAGILGQLPPAQQSGQPMLAGVFGSIYPQWSDAGWMDRVSALLDRIGRRLVIVQFGRAGESGHEVLARLRRHAAGRVEFLELGERPPAEVSALLQGLDFGVATTPWPLIGKSSAAAAMLEHGLPVLVTREGDTLRDGTLPAPVQHPRLFQLRGFCEALERGALTRGKPQARSDVYDAFIGALEGAS